MANHKADDNALSGAAANSELKRRLFVINAFALLTLLSLSVFGALQVLVENNPVVGALELAGALVVAMILLGLKITKNVTIARACLVATILTFLIVMLTSGGTQGTGIFWLFAFPIAAFFLTGKRQGLYWMFVLFSAIFFLWAAARSTNVPLYYSDIQIRQAVATLAVATAGMYVYQGAREKSEQEAKARRRAERHVLTRMEQLHTKVDRTKSEFVTLASHQLRTPISAISWSSEMLLSGDAGALKATQRDYIQGIYDSNKRLGAIVDSMLLVSGLELGELHVHPEPLNLKTLTGKLLREEVKKHADKALVVQEYYDKELPKLNLDSTVMKRILQNIFSNAVKYSPQGGMITVTISQSAQKLLPDSAGTVVIDVADTGYGIPVEDQDNVFAKLFRAENIKKRDTDGTGLGLYIVKALLDQTGGRISFVSQENKGSTFTIHLPLEGMKPKGG